MTRTIETETVCRQEETPHEPGAGASSGLGSGSCPAVLPGSPAAGPGTPRGAFLPPAAPAPQLTSESATEVPRGRPGLREHRRLSVQGGDFGGCGEKGPWRERGRRTPGLPGGAVGSAHSEGTRPRGAALLRSERPACVRSDARVSETRPSASAAAMRSPWSHCVVGSPPHPPVTPETRR